MNLIDAYFNTFKLNKHSIKRNSQRYNNRNNIKENNKKR